MRHILETSLSGPLLPRNRETGSYGQQVLESIYLDEPGGKARVA